LVDEDGRFLDGGALRAKLSALGVKPGQPVITHCQGGGRASVDAFALERLGHPARNYYLGWSDWGNAADTPVEAGQGTAKRP
jgi:thiosulfate/3-mercaptopyruvate sulfurtransferase